MMEVAVRVVLAGVLLVAAAGKLARPRQTAGAMSTYGFDAAAGQWVAWGSMVVAELALAIGVLAGSDAAAFAAGGLMMTAAAVMANAIMRGKAGEPCGCFGVDSRVSTGAIARNVLLGAAFIAVPYLPEGSLATDTWLAIGLGVAMAAIIGLAVAVLALAREVGMLRLRLGPSSALEVSHEGPEVGGRSGVIERFAPTPRAEFALAVFSSEGCHICRALEPAIESLRSEPSLTVLSFTEGDDADVWEQLGIPGAPYAVALDRDGYVMAKGTYNNLSQLESIVATAERRQAERSRVEALGV